MLKDWMNWAYSQATVTSCPMLAVLLAIVTHADAAGFCRPSIARLSSLTRLDPRTVQRQIRALEVAGLLRREIGGGWMHKSGDKNLGRASVYQLLRRLESTEPTAETYPDTVPPWMNSTPSACHLGIPIDSRPPRHPAALTEVGKKDGGGGTRRCGQTSSNDLTPIDEVPAGFARPGKWDPPRVQSIDAGWLDQLVEAMGWAQSGRKPTHDDIVEAMAWGDQLGLSQANQLEVIREVLPTKSDPEPPFKFRYFSQAMARRAELLARAPLELTHLNGNHGVKANERPGRNSQVQRIIEAAARGSSGKDWG
jgi:DNA-binding transcriptional ArsR family regulator